MKAMILAAGFGTRLAPFTDQSPKALVPVAGRPMIAWALDAAARAGCSAAVVNAHHHADVLEEHFRHVRYPLPVTVLREGDILGTGGGLRNARALLEDAEAVLVHNADIVTGFDLRALAAALLHPPPPSKRPPSSQPLAVLAVQRRPTERALLCDASMRLLGKEAWEREGERYPEPKQRLAFCGIHVVSPAIFALEYPEGFADIFDLYRAAMRAGHAIACSEMEGAWCDLGTAEAIRRWETMIRQP